MAVGMGWYRTRTGPLAPWGPWRELTDGLRLVYGWVELEFSSELPFQPGYYRVRHRATCFPNCHHSVEWFEQKPEVPVGSTFEGLWEHVYVTSNRHGEGE